MASLMTPWVEPPADQGDLRVRGSFEPRGGDLRGHAGKLAGALLDHLAADVGVGELVADQHAVLVVLVGGDHMGVAREPRYGAGRNAAVGVLVTLVAAPLAGAGVGQRPVAPGGALGDQRAAVDLRAERDGVRIDTEGPFGDEQVRDEDPPGTGPGRPG